jgi:hypothetical protein
LEMFNCLLLWYIFFEAQLHVQHLFSTTLWRASSAPV